LLLQQQLIGAIISKVGMKIWNIGQAVTREEVIWCYQTLLGREPESEDAILPHLESGSFKSLVRSFVSTSEYAARTAALSKIQLYERPEEELPEPEEHVLISPEHNEALAKAEFNAGVHEVRSTPSMLTLETSSRCNLRCVMCPQAINVVKRPKHMESEMIVSLERFIRQSNNVQLHGIGEPLASPAFWDSLKFIPESCDSSINTNLTVLDDRRLKNLVASQLRAINVSLDAARPETYQKIRGFSFEEVTNNIRRFVDARRESGKKFPLLFMNMTLMRSNIEEVLEFIDMAADMGADSIYFWHLNHWPDEEMAPYVLEREGWTFDYKKEGLWNFPELSNEYLRKAEIRARERGINLRLDQNKTVYFDPLESAA
jgi:sulfatase maturation enzyme AslB (radical SAM superfamily)